MLMISVANINNRNYWAIKDFAYNNSVLKPFRVEALYRLIQLKGEPVKSNSKDFDGLKALRISEFEYITINHVPVYPDSFFPCMLRTTILTTLPLPKIIMS